MRIFYSFLLSFFVCSLMAQLSTDKQQILHQLYLNDVNNQKEENIHILSTHLSKKSNIQHIYFQQQVNNIKIVKTYSNLALVDRQAVAFNHKFISSTIDIKKSQNFKISNESAIKAVATHLNHKYSAAKLESKSSGVAYFSSTLFSDENIWVENVYYPTKKGLVDAYEITVFTKDKLEWWQYYINTNDGQVLDRNTWTISCNWDHDCSINHPHKHHNHKNHNYTLSNSKTSLMNNEYNVFPIPLLNPDEGGRNIETAPWLSALNASPFGWHDTDGVTGEEFTITRGNNVHAYEDRENNNSPGDSPDGGANLVFDNPFDPNNNPVDYQDAAITNLFYWNNIIHDVLYQYGFDEASGNFQENNYGNGGFDSDYVNAEAQDGAGTNNANFSAPVDGNNGRMQMFEWSIGNDVDFEVTVPSNIAGSYNAPLASFGPQSGSFSGTLVEAVPNLACSPITNGADIDGNIALIDRGTCNFTIKVEEAQDVGAIAVVMCQNSNDNPFSMGGNNNSINIPSVMLSQSDCDLIRANMPGVEVSFDLSGPSFLDSDLDNGVIIHEYGHGVSIRLTGGGNNSSCLSNDEQMGEGWSDYLALVMTIKSSDVADLGNTGRGIGTYLVGESPTANGIRSFPYSTNLSTNPHTYNDIGSESIPHGVGSVWSNMLWEMTWSLIDQYGFDNDIYNGTGGNNIALELVLEGMKLQPCSPGFVDGRDAILLADEIINGGQNQCLIWNAFAKRGLGFGASQGSSSNVNDGSESFDLPPICLDTVIITKEGPQFTKAGDTIDYKLTVFNNTDDIITNMIGYDTLDSRLTFVNGSLSNGQYNSGIIRTNQATMNPTDQNISDFKATVANADSSILVGYEDFELSTSLYTGQVGQGSGIWELSTSNPYRGSFSYFVPNIGEDNTQFLVSEPFTLPASPMFSLYHSFITELGWDGGIIELTDDGGATWKDLGQYMILGNYNGSLGSSSNADIAGRAGFTGNSLGYIRTIIDLDIFANQTVQFRFIFGSDNNTFEDGWHIDDIMIYDKATITNEYCVNYDHPNTLSFCEEINTIILPNCELYNRYYIDNDLDGYGDVDGTTQAFGCSLPTGYAINNEDCNDADDKVFPGQTEVCGNGIDDNCDGIQDEDCIFCDDINLDIPTVLQAEYKAKIKLNTDAQVPINGSYKMTAGDTICIEAGFEVPANTTFEAILEDCILSPSP